MVDEVALEQVFSYFGFPCRLLHSLLNLRHYPEFRPEVQRKTTNTVITIGAVDEIRSAHTWDVIQSVAA
jgi:hypothetical protein